MRIVIQDGGRIIWSQDVRPDQAAQIRQYSDSIVKDARAAQPKQTVQQLPSTPQEEARARKNARPSTVQRHWWMVPDDNGIVGQDQGDQAGPNMGDAGDGE